MRVRARCLAALTAIILSGCSSTAPPRADAVAVLVGASVQVIGGHAAGRNPKPLASRETLGPAGPSAR